LVFRQVVANMDEARLAGASGALAARTVVQ